MIFQNTKDITVPVATSYRLHDFLTSQGVQEVNLQTVDLDATATVPAHEGGAVLFGVKAVAKLCEILGIAPWSLF